MSRWLSFREPYRRTRLGPLTNLIGKPRPIRGRHAIVILLALLTFSCGGFGKTAQPTGVYYQVQTGDTLTKIAKTYHISPRKLAEINNLSQPDQLLENTVIFIPYSDETGEGGTAPVGKGPKPEKVSAKAAKEAALEGPRHNSPDEAQTTPSTASKKAPAKSGSGITPPAILKTPISQPLWEVPPALPESGRKGTPEPRHKESPQTSKETGGPGQRPEEVTSEEKGRFSWPVKGKVTNRFGLQPNGMYFNHIRIVTRESASVVAAAPGTVIFSAPLKEFGETIIIKHDQRFATVYTHLSTRSAKVDHRVRKGEQIGLAGKAETRTEGYIHFEIRDHNKSRNPLLFLP